MQGRDLIPCGNGASISAIRQGEIRFFDIFDMWGAGKSPSDHRHYYTFLEHPLTKDRIDKLREVDGVKATFIDQNSGRMFIHEDLATQYAEDLSTDVWLAVRRYIKGAQSPKAPASPLDALRYTLDALEHQQHQIAALEDMGRKIETKVAAIHDQVNHKTGFVSCLGWCRIRGLRFPEPVSGIIGNEMARRWDAAKARGHYPDLERQRISDGRHGFVWTYPDEFLDENMPVAMKYHGLM